MRSGEYTSRRGASYVSQSSWTRNRNIVRHEGRGLGPISLIGMFLMLITVMGMIYLTQGTKATSYDYALDELDTEIAELTAEKEDLAVEKARLTSIAATNDSQVAAAMPVATSAGYVDE
ncbi:hypothetical protein IJ103_02420 [Candidatus Saccharibacteria bacterium]|nr:hypothetical protein [Candidatus Saccharibacteria bacterium]